MKKQFTTKMKVFTAVGVLSTMSLTAIAAPILQEVSATLRKDITFTINGEKTLDGASTLVYNDTTYIPVRALVEELGLQVNYENGNIAISAPSEQSSRNTSTDVIDATELTPALESVFIPEATITAISEDGEQVTIQTADDMTIILNVGTLDISNLEVDMKVSVTHSPAMTRSLPPQTAAFEINELTETVLEEVELKDVEIVEINGNSLTVGNIEDPSNPYAQTIIHLKDETPIVHEKNKRLYTQEDLEVGQKLTVIHEPIMTLSLPGQTTAIKIILVD